MSANPAGNRRARNQSASVRYASLTGFGFVTDKQTPHCGGVTECDRNVRLPATHAPPRDIGAATPRLAGISTWVIEFREANHITAAATATIVEEVFVGIHEEAWLVIFMQRDTLLHPSATAEWPRRAPILRVQIAHQRESALSSRRELRDSRTACLDGQNTAERVQIPGNDGGRSKK